MSYDIGVFDKNKSDNGPNAKSFQFAMEDIWEYWCLCFVLGLQSTTF